ncbi:hypothetical protein OG429_40200 (plasmid) [Streptomyces sp. NBC_00190]|uniref:hypothetical protein n=1 Tax=unclassified Streptomyces TaxID=2593676 RepID=UPI002E27F485|nr:hypothetical protein [Streptomyces sp. NBC_00190]WSZ45812.1 hypothetical protein OG239_44415 [Streptomyces sp. NBC_00868]
MITRRPLGTGPRPATDTPAAAGPRALLAAEAVEVAPAAEATSATSPADRSAAAPGRRHLGPGTAAADH